MSIKPELLRLRDKVKEINFELEDTWNSLEILGNEVKEVCEELERMAKDNQ